MVRSLASRKSDRKCEVCGKRMHKVQACGTCGKALCNNHLSKTRHDCVATDESTRIEPEGKPSTLVRIPGKIAIAICVVVVVAVLGAVMLLGGNGSPGEEEVQITEVIPGANFSIELSMSKITEYMMESMGRGGRPGGQLPGGEFPGGGFPGGRPFGNGTIPDEFRNRTRIGGLGLMGGISEFLVAVPESLEVEDPTSASVSIRVIRESQGGYDIYGVNITTLSYETYDPANQPCVNLNLTAPASAGTHDIYVTTMRFSGLDTSSPFRQVIGEYYIGDLAFVVRERVEVA